MTKVTLIFGRSSKFVGLLIRFFDVSPYSHVAILDGDYVYESVGGRYKGRVGRRKGVIKTPVDVFKRRYSAWRTKEVWTSNESWREQCELLVSQKTEYDFAATLGALWFFRLLRIHLGSNYSYNCSELVGHVTKRFIDGYSPTVSDLWRLKE